MQFQFPNKQQIKHFQRFQDLNQFRVIVSKYKNQYLLGHMLISYQFRCWYNINQAINKMAAYCHYCSAKIVYSKKSTEQFYKLQILVQHHFHSQIDKSPKKYVKKQQKKIKIKQKNQQIQQFNQQKKDFIAQWIQVYQQNVKNQLRQNQFSKKEIDHKTCRSNTNKIILLRHKNGFFLQSISQMLNQNAQQILYKKNFTQQNSTLQQISSNQSMYNKVYIKQNELKGNIYGKKIIYLIRKTIKIQLKGQTNLIICYQLNTKSHPTIKWFQVLQPSSQQKSNPLLVLCLLKKLYPPIKCQIISSLTIMIQNDPILMNVLKSIRQYLNRKQIHMDFVIHSSFVSSFCQEDRQIVEGFVQLVYQVSTKGYQQNLRQIIITNGNSVLVDYFMQFSQYYCYSQIAQRCFVGLNFLSKEFYQRNGLIQYFSYINKILTINTQISCLQLITIITQLFQSLAQNRQIKQNNTQEQQINHIKACLPTQSPQIHSIINNQFLPKQCYNFKQLIDKFPRIIIQLIYQQSAKALKLFVLKVDIQIILGKGFVKVKDNIRNAVFNVLINREHYEASNLNHTQINRNHTQPNGNHAQINGDHAQINGIRTKINENHVKTNGDHTQINVNHNKIWNCQCQYYNKVGIPCEHQLICAYNFKTSISSEINSIYKLQAQ